LLQSHLQQKSCGTDAKAVEGSVFSLLYKLPPGERKIFQSGEVTPRKGIVAYTIPMQRRRRRMAKEKAKKKAVKKIDKAVRKAVKKGVEKLLVTQTVDNAMVNAMGKKVGAKKTTREPKIAKTTRKPLKVRIRDGEAE
jgi:hypothetical protein